MPGLFICNQRLVYIGMMRLYLLFKMFTIFL